MRQKFSDKHPVLGLLVCTYGGFLISEFLFGMLLAFVFSKIGFDMGTGTAIGGSVGSILVLLFWYFRNQPEYRFMPRKGEISGSLKLIFVPILIWWILLFGSYAYFCKGFPFASITLREVFMSLMAGLVEEICFREIAVSYMSKHWMSEKSIPRIAVISGVMFGLTHITNLVGEKDVTDTLIQVLLCVFFGVFFTAIYLRKGNVWVLCLFHFIHDLLAFMGVAGFAAKGIAELPDWITFYLAATEFGLCLYGFFLIRKSKRQEIIELWDYKWSRRASDRAADKLLT